MADQNIKDLYKLAEAMEKLAGSKTIKVLNALKYIVPAGIAGAGGYVAKGFLDRKKENLMREYLPEETTPTEVAEMRALYNRGVNDGAKYMYEQMINAANGKGKKAEDEDKLVSLLKMTAASLRKAAEDLKELANENATLQVEIKSVKLAEDLVKRGVASTREQAVNIIKEASASGDPADAIESILKKLNVSSPGSVDGFLE